MEHFEPGEASRATLGGGMTQGPRRVKSEGGSGEKDREGTVTWEAPSGQATAKLTSPGLRHPTAGAKLWSRELRRASG